MSALKPLPMRLAMRAEGDKWNAYVARAGTMEGAIWVGSIALKFVEYHRGRRDAFLALMRDAMTEVIEEVLDQRPTWSEPTDAPEHERTKE